MILEPELFAALKPTSNKKVLCKCDSCGETRYVVKAGITRRSMAPECYCKPCAARVSAERRKAEGAHVQYPAPEPGTRFGRWVAIAGEVVTRGNGIRYVPMRCECGVERHVNFSALRAGLSLSCKCVIWKAHVARSTKHGESTTRLYRRWRSMLNRCSTPNVGAAIWALYGGRGIRVCAEWQDYETFRDWAKASGHEDGLSIERIDNDGDYEPGNCRWATQKEQSRNRRNSLLLTAFGETKALTAWAEDARCPLSVKQLRRRVAKGITLEEMLTL